MQKNGVEWNYKEAENVNSQVKYLKIILLTFHHWIIISINPERISRLLSVPTHINNTKQQQQTCWSVSKGLI